MRQPHPEGGLRGRSGKMPGIDCTEYPFTGNACGIWVSSTTEPVKVTGVGEAKDHQGTVLGLQR